MIEIDQQSETDEDVNNSGEISQIKENDALVSEYELFSQKNLFEILSETYIDGLSTQEDFDKFLILATPDQVIFAFMYIIEKGDINSLEIFYNSLQFQVNILDGVKKKGIKVLTDKSFTILSDKKLSIAQIKFVAIMRYYIKKENIDDFLNNLDLLKGIIGTLLKKIDLIQ